MLGEPDIALLEPVEDLLAVTIGVSCLWGDGARKKSRLERASWVVSLVKIIEKHVVCSIRHRGIIWNGKIIAKAVPEGLHAVPVAERRLSVGVVATANWCTSNSSLHDDQDGAALDEQRQMGQACFLKEETAGLVRLTCR